MSPLDTATTVDYLSENVEDAPSRQTEKFLFTAASVAKLVREKADKLGLQVWDTRQPGFGIAISKGGALSYFYQIRIKQQKSPYRRVVGKLADYSPEAARREATRLIQHVRAHGVDPREADAPPPVEDADQRTVYDLLVAWTAAAARPDYRIEAGALKPTSLAAMKRRLPHLQALWGGVKLSEATVKRFKADIDNLTHGYLDGAGKPTKKATPGLARAYKSYLSKAWRWGGEHDWPLPPLPIETVKVKRPGKREISLTDDQLHKVFAWIAAYWQSDDPTLRTPVRDEAVAAIELIIRSGKRKVQIATIRIDNFFPGGTQDYDRIVIDEKVAVEGTLWMSGPDCPMRAVIARALEMRKGRSASPYLFPLLQRRDRRADLPVSMSQIGKTFTIIKKDCVLQSPRRAADKSREDVDVVIHDLRHTYVGAASRAGLDTFHASKLLGHTTPEMVNSIYLNLQQPELAKHQRLVQRYLSAVEAGDHVDMIYKTIPVGVNTYDALAARANREGITMDEMILKLLTATA